MPLNPPFFVDPNGIASPTTFLTIQDAVNAASPGTVITVAPGTYNENVTISVSGITLQSSGGAGPTIINGSAGGGSVGTIVVTPGVNDVTIGGTGSGFTINGYDGPFPAIETSAVYLQGTHDNITIRGNEIVANGDGGLQGETAPLTNIVVDDNVFSGQTFVGPNPGGSGFGSQWNDPNVPRQLVVLGSNGGSSSNITFTNNEVTGTAGGLNSGGNPQGNTLVTIDAANSIISDNEFTGFTNRFATQLRVREEGTTITDNTFFNDTGNVGIFSDFGPGEVSGPITGNLLDYGSGDDLLIATVGDDVMDGGAGIDTIAMVNAGAAGSVVDLESGLAFSPATGIDTVVNVENISGSIGSDALYGNAQDNTFYATGGADQINGRGGSDTFDASSAVTPITANLATGVVTGAVTATLTNVENITTGGGADIVTGSAANNVIRTGGGADIVNINTGAGSGTDSVDGGSGVDTVVFDGARSAYTVTWDGTEAVVTHTATGSVTHVSNAGTLGFADSHVLLVSPTGDYTTIQAAVDAAGNGDQILVAAGTYIEQVVVDGIDGLTITAVGNVVLQAPADVTYTAISTSGRDINAVLTVLDSADVVIDGLTVDGAGHGNTVDEGPGADQANYVGIYYGESSGGLENVDVIGVRDPYPNPLDLTVDGFPIVSGTQRGVGVQVDNTSLQDFFMHGGSISDFQKNATVFNFANLDIDGVEITGGGAQDVIAQNGFQVLNSTGEIINCIVSHIGYAGPDVVYSACFLLYGSDLDILDNTITGANDATPDAQVVGIYVLDLSTANSGGEISGNFISFVDEGIDVSGNIGPNPIFVHDNSVTDIDLGDQYAAGVAFIPTPSLLIDFNVEGSDAADFISGAGGDDQISGLDGADILTGLGGDDTIDGGDGADLISGGAGADSLTGGDGDDTFHYDAPSELASGETVDGGDGVDTVELASTGAAAYNLGTAFSAIEAIRIGTPSDTANIDVDASGVVNGLTITGNAGVNVITGTAFGDTIDGGDGIDTVALEGSRADYTVEWDGTTATVTNIALGRVDTITDTGRLLFTDAGEEVLLVGTGGDFTTIQSAVDAAVHGAEILLQAGATYIETVVATDNPLTIVGGAGTTLVGSFTIAGALDDTFTIRDLAVNATGQAVGISVTAHDDGDSGVVLDNVDVSNASQNGFAYIRVGNGSTPILFDTIDAISILGSTFTDNGRVNTGGGGRGDILIYGFNGAIEISDTDITNTTGVAQRAIQIRGVQAPGDVSGVGPFSDLQDLVLDGLNITGIYQLDAVAVYRFAALLNSQIDSIEFDVTANWGAINFDEVGGVVDLSGVTGTNLAGDLIGVMQGLASAETFTGTDGYDVIDGRGGADTIVANGGDDVILYTSAGHMTAQEHVDGGDGRDTILFASAAGGTLVLNGYLTNTEVVQISTATGLNNVAMNIDASGVTEPLNGAPSLLAVVCGIDGLEINGNAAANIIIGTMFDDQINGAGGNDTLNGGAGFDTIVGGDGDDSLIGGSDDDVLEGGAGADIINGGSGYDAASYESSSAGVSIDLFEGTATGGDATGDTLALIEDIIGSSHGDTLTGDDLDNIIDGGAGNDLINGGGSADVLFDGAGDDSVYGGDGGDFVGNGDGNDYFYGGVDDDSIAFDLDWSAYTITCSGDTYTITDGTFTDVVTGFEGFFFNDGAADVTSDPDSIVTSAPPEITDVVEIGIDEDTNDQTIAVDENSAPGTLVAAVTATDPNLVVGDTITFTLVDSNGDEYTGPFQITAGDNNDAEITVSGPIDFEQAASQDLYVRVTDADGHYATTTVTVAINDVNEAPSAIVTETPPLTVDENTEGAIITTVSSEDPDAGDSITWSVDDNRFEVVETAPNSGQYVLRLKEGQSLDYEAESSVDVEVTAEDGSGLQTSTTVTIGVNDINESPGGPGGLTVWSPDAVEAGLRRAVLTPDAVVIDPEGDPLTYELVTGPTQGALYSGTLVTVGTVLSQAEFDALTYQAPEAAGSFGATFRVSDGVNTNTPFSVVLTVSAPVNGTYTGDATNNSLDGGGGNDSVFGLEGSDTLYGGTGIDTLDGGTGNDSMIGGAGNDSYIVDNAGDVVVEGTGEGVNDRVSVRVNYTLGAGVQVETMTTTSVAGTSALSLIGNALAQTIIGNAGNNTLGDGGGMGADTLRGNGGNDTYIIRNAGSVIIETAGQGNDVVTAAVSYVLAADADIERLRTTSQGGTASINLTGNALAQLITGNAGANILDSGTGAADTLSGMAGNDTYLVRNAGDLIEESSGNGTADRVIASVSFALASDDNIEIMSLENPTGTAALNLTGNALAQTITGNDGANQLSDGSAGASDVLIGRAGDDIYIIRNTGTLIDETAGNGTSDRVSASTSFALAADDDIEVMTTTNSGGVTTINLTGNALIQSITGNAGTNILNGMGGSDRLTGGAGADTFVFNTALGANNVDQITDFVSGLDKIDLSALIFNTLDATATPNADEFVIGPAAVDADDRLIYNQATGSLYYDADGNGAGAAVEFARLQPGTTLVVTDFIMSDYVI